jgi:hypothetical protein
MGLPPTCLSSLAFYGKFDIIHKQNSLPWPGQWMSFRPASRLYPEERLQLWGDLTRTFQAEVDLTSFKPLVRNYQRYGMLIKEYLEKQI